MDFFPLLVWQTQVFLAMQIQAHVEKNRQFSVSNFDIGYRSIPGIVIGLLLITPRRYQ